MKHKFKRLAALMLVLALLVPCLPTPGAAARDYTRISGKDRYATSLLAADALKQVMGVEYFDTIILASGTGFADALAGSYLAAMRRAPIILVADSQIDKVRDYIYDNLSKDGIIYLLGGTGAVSAKVEQSLEGYMVKRLSGTNRYATNIAILNEAGIFEGEVVICTGKGFADSLSASAVGRPIVLVGDSLTAQQEELLAQTSGEFVIIGGTGAVSTDVENRLKELGTVTRLSGKSRYETSVEVAAYFFSFPRQAVLAYAQNFPDGLSGGPLAYALGAPLLLTANGNENTAAFYAQYNMIGSGYVLGGQGLISDDTADAIFVDGPDCEDFDHDHFCDDCGEKLSECADGSRDHLCDYCGAVLSECADYSWDHICDYCYQRMSECYNEDGDCYCDYCGAWVSNCQDSDFDHYCDICGILLSVCTDSNGNGFCDICGKDMHLCADGNFDHLCDNCGMRLSDCGDNDSDHFCDHCYLRLSDCTDENRDHNCDICGEVLTLCEDGNSNHFCDECGKQISLCTDENWDHLCDICFTRISYCADEDGDGFCDHCGLILPGADCADTNNDHFCDDCGNQISFCYDSDFDHICDFCNVPFSICEDVNGDGTCDYCGWDLSGCADNDCNHFCDDCGRQLSFCINEDGDHFCDLCGFTITSCEDEDGDGICNICGQHMPGASCSDADGDYICDLCGMPWGVSELQQSTPYVFQDVGYITTEAETIDTGDLVYHIGENVYVPGHLQEISTILAETTQQVSGLTFAGNGYGQLLYPDDKIHVNVSRDQISPGCPMAETGAAYADRASHAMLAPGFLFLYDVNAIPHEVAHVVRMKQSGWEFSRPLEEGFAEFTSHWILGSLERTDPASSFYLGRASDSPWNMAITDYDALYAQPIEYWLENEFPYSGNTFYCVGFRFMYYLQDTYGNYTQWVTDYEAAYPCTAPSHSWEGVQADLASVLEIMKQTYGADVLDNFYPWLRENEALFEPLWDETYVDATDVDAINLYPKMYDDYSHTELYRMDYEDLYVNLESVRSYLEDYKGIDASALTLYNPDKLTVNLYHADGSYTTVYGHEEVSLENISYIKLVGKGRLDLLRIYGYEGCKQEWE